MATRLAPSLAIIMLWPSSAEEEEEEEEESLFKADAVSEEIFRVRTCHLIEWKFEPSLKSSAGGLSCNTALGWGSRLERIVLSAR